MYSRIRALREDADLKQKTLAEMLNIHQTTYSDYELGHLNIPAPILVELAYFYDTSVDYILGVTDVQEPYPRRNSHSILDEGRKFTSSRKEQQK